MNETFIAGVLQEVILTHEALFFLSEKNGTVSPEAEKGLGLYYHDC